MNIKHLFAEVSEKFDSLRVVSEKGAKYSRHHYRSAFAKVEFEPIYRSISQFDKDEVKAYVETLIISAEKIITDERLLRRVAESDDNCIEFSTVEKCVEEYRNDLREIKERLSYLIELLMDSSVESNNVESNNSDILGDTMYGFKTSIFNSLARFQIDDSPIFKDDIEDGVLIANISSFFSGNYKQMKSELNFIGAEDRVIYFLIHHIAKHSKQKLKAIKRIKINGKPFNDRHCSKAVSEINTQRCSGSLSVTTLRQVESIESFLCSNLKKEAE
jgi:hypothetical protein